MATSSFEAHIRPQPPVAIVDMQGEVNALAADALNAAYDEAISQQPAAILLNFQRVDYINSTGIALVVGLLKRTRQDNLSLWACNLSEHYVEIFRITRLIDYLRLFPNEESALQAKRSTSS